MRTEHGQRDHRPSIYGRPNRRHVSFAVKFIHNLLVPHESHIAFWLQSQFRMITLTAVYRLTAPPISLSTCLLHQAPAGGGTIITKLILSLFTIIKMLYHILNMYRHIQLTICCCIFFFLCVLSEGTGSSDLQMKKARWTRLRWRPLVGEHKSEWCIYTLCSGPLRHHFWLASFCSGLAQTLPFTPAWGWPAPVTRILNRSWLDASKKLVSVTFKNAVFLSWFEIRMH